MKLSDILIKEIYKSTGTNKFFGYIGGMVAHIVDSIYNSKDVELVNTINEQGAGFAAEGYARTTGKIGIAVATSGPGATNLVTPIANSFFDSTPVLFITGQVNTYEYQKYDIKQCGFQETNIVDIVKPITKYSTTVKNAKDLKYELQKAIHIATTGRKGPVLLDIPMDIQRADVDEKDLKNFIPEQIYLENMKFDKELFEKSKKPLILLGNGVILSNAKSELRKFITNTQIPVVESLLGVDSVEYDYKYNLGMIGTYGNRYGNLALYDCDLLLVLGSRLDIRQTGAKIDFMSNKTIIHVDIDEKELNCPKFNKIKIKSDIKEFLKYINNQDFNLNIKNWQDKVLKFKETFSDENNAYKLPNIILSEIFKNLNCDDVIIADVGQNQVWSGQSAKIVKNQRMFSSGGHGCMGFALPAGIGATFSGKRAIVITGDGGLQMNIQELEIIKRRNLPVKIVVMNNKSLGMVRTFQELYFDKRYASTVEDYSAPDFVKVANAYGISAVAINSDYFDIEKINKYLKDNNPVLINIILPQETQVEPRIQFGNSIENAHPLVSPDLLKGLLAE